MQQTFKVGDKVRVNNSYRDSQALEVNGMCGTVRDDTLRTYLNVRLDGDDCVWLFKASELDAVTSPTVADDLRLTPQAKTVLRHLKKHGDITPMKAMCVYGISRLASCIHEIRRRAGYQVGTQVAQDDQGHKYAVYSLA